MRGILCRSTCRQGPARPDAAHDRRWIADHGRANGAAIVFAALGAQLGPGPPRTHRLCRLALFGCMSRPVIGICTALERARWGVWDAEAAILPRSYLLHVQRAGGLGILLAPDPVATEQPDELLDLLDGLLLIGGADIHPAAYGAQPDPRTEATYPERDAFELALARRALERELPFLGVCRGM